MKWGLGVKGSVWFRKWMRIRKDHAEGRKLANKGQKSDNESWDQRRGIIKADYMTDYE